MSSQIKNYCCLVIFLFISTLCFSQKQFHITIQFVPKLDTNNIVVSLDNGKGMRDIPVLVKNGKIEIKSEVYSKYATLSLHTPVTYHQKTYFITNEVSSIIYFGNNKSSKDYPFVNSKLINAIELTNCKEIKNLMDYTQKERNDLLDFREKHNAELETNDSLMSIYKQKDKILLKKSMDFIKLNSDQYFYLWYFNLGYRGSDAIEADSLLHFYNDALYPKYKNLFEAKRILDYLKGRTLKTNQLAPDFTTKDISGRNFSLKQLRGKYVLINIWATWCGPCVAELPLIKKLRDDFPANQLEMISVSEDDTQADLENGIKKYGLNWTHVFKDTEILNKYQISNGIPKTFLIDKEGRLVFKTGGPLIETDEIRKLLLKK